MGWHGSTSSTKDIKNAEVINLPETDGGGRLPDGGGRLPDLGGRLPDGGGRLPELDGGGGPLCLCFGGGLDPRI